MKWWGRCSSKTISRVTKHSRGCCARVCAVLVLLVLIAGCATRRPLVVTEGGPWQGNASWYGIQFHGRLAADGSRYNMYELTAAHRTLPFGTRLLVTNVNNGRKVKVKITDRGPFVEGRIIDLSFAAAQELDMLKDGVVLVRLEPLP